MLRFVIFNVNDHKIHSNFSARSVIFLIISICVVDVVSTVSIQKKDDEAEMFTTKKEKLPFWRSAVDGNEAMLRTSHTASAWKWKNSLITSWKKVLTGQRIRLLIIIWPLWLDTVPPRNEELMDEKLWWLPWEPNGHFGEEEKTKTNVWRVMLAR